MLISILHRLIRLRYAIGGFHFRTIQAEGCTLSSLVSASHTAGRTLFLLHGLGTSSSSWVNILSALARNYNVVAIDLPGFGFSTLPPGRPYLTLSEFDRILDLFAREALPPRFTLVGHSLGGWLAMRFAVNHAALVEKLVLINPAGVRYPGIEQQAKLFSLRLPRDVQTLLETMWHRYPLFFKLFNRAVFHDLMKRNVPAFVESINKGDFVNDSLSRLTMPVHIIWGKEDRLIAPDSLRILTHLLPSASVTLIENCGHIPQLEKPRELLQVFAGLLP